MQDVRQQRSQWMLLVPISNLTLTEAVNFEITIERVTFIDGSKLPQRRRRFGFPDTISALRTRHRAINRVFESGTCFAVLRRAGKIDDFEELALALIRDELALLNLSKLGYAKRSQIASPSISRERPTGSRSYLILRTDGKAWSQPNQAVGNLGALRLDGVWKRFHEKGFFHTLIRIIRGEIHVSKAWRRDLRNAAILVGQSQTSSDVPQAFLWNMIALELLLTEQGDKYSEELPARAEAFLGWIGFWGQENFAERIREVYTKRSAFVHAGRRDLITRQDLFFTDDLLFNILINIIGHHRLFKDKTDVVSFSKRVQAEHLLGVNAKVRPKSLRFLRRFYSEKDFQP